MDRGRIELIFKVTGEQGVESCTFIWKPTHMTPVMADQVFRSQRVRVYNHIQNIRGLTTKNGLVKSMKHYYKDERTAREVRYTAWESMPTSFLLAAQNMDFEYKQFCQRFKELAQGYSTKQRMPMKHCERNMWLVKPAAMNQGRGIQIFKNLIDIQTFINSKNLNSHFIVQKYLQRPLLYRNYKFDIRVWVLLTWKNDVLFFKRGYLRLSSFEYNANPANLSVHLTNQMLQKKFQNYGKVYEGNAISFEEFEEYLNEIYPDHKINVEEHIVSRMKDMIIDSCLSVKKNLNPQKRKDVFELLGYDFMVDQDLRTWLIEVNTNPSLGSPSNEYCEKMFDKMLTQLYSLMVFPAIEGEMKVQLDQTEWELLYCESNSSFSEIPVNIRRPFHEGVYPLPELEQRNKQPSRFYKIAGTSHSKHQSVAQYYDRKGAPDVALSQSPQLFPPIQRGLARSAGKNLRSKSSSLQIARQSQNRFYNKRAARRIEQYEGLNTGVLLQDSRVQESGVIDSLKNSKEYNFSFIVKKDIFQEVKDYVAAKNYTKEGVLILFRKVYTKFLHWELTSEKNRPALMKALILLFGPTLSVHLGHPSEIDKLILLLQKQEIPPELRSCVATVLQKLARGLQNRALLLRGKYLNPLMKVVLGLAEKQELTPEEKMLYQAQVKLLCELCSVCSTSFYIPGETNEILRMQSQAKEKGLFLFLFHIFSEAPDSVKEILNNLVMRPLGSAGLTHHQEFLRGQLPGLVSREGTSQEAGQTPNELSLTVNEGMFRQQTPLTDLKGASAKTSASNKGSSNLKTMLAEDRKTIEESQRSKTPLKVMPETHYNTSNKLQEILRTSKGESQGDGRREDSRGIGSRGLMERIDISGVKRMLSKRIAQLYQEQIQRQELENKRRVERMHQESLQKEQREKHLEERRRKAEEIFRKRVEENRRIQEMMNKRAREEEVLRAQMEQERKERLQKIIKKRSED